MKTRITKRVIIKYEIDIITGIHIGGNAENYGIGGIDSPVIKDPLTNKPIIPGSSVKGKLRMLLSNIKDDIINNDIINKAFGQSTGKTDQVLFTRIIFRDLFLTDASSQKLQKYLGEGFFTEIKAENTISLDRGIAMPRFIERVPAGTTFEGECVVQYLEEDKEDFVTLLKQGFELLEYNALGASGSRGYGKVKVRIVQEQTL